MKRSTKRITKRITKRSTKRSTKRIITLSIDGGVNYNRRIDYGINYDFKLIELEGCPACVNAKKLIKDKDYSLHIKKELDPEESDIIKRSIGGTYDYFPKIFKFNNKTDKYDFIGGYDKLQEII